MIYLDDIDIAIFSKKYRIKADLNYTHTCAGCNKKVLRNRPFITKGYAGFETQPCGCTDKGTKSLTATTRTKEEHDSWLGILGVKEFKK